LVGACLTAILLFQFKCLDYGLAHHMLLWVKFLKMTSPPYFQLAVTWAIFHGPCNWKESETIIVSPFSSSSPFPSFVLLYFLFTLTFLFWTFTMLGGIMNR
jgi:hypothetical protein